MEDEKIYQTVRDFVSGYNVEVSDHIIDIIVSVIRTRDGIHPIGGSFVQAIVNNDLYDAVTRGDNDCIKNLKIIAIARRNCFVN
jgi:hypothetical protein